MVKDLPQGWLTGDEAKALAKLAKGKAVLELGAFKGRSTVVMAEVAEYVVSVDRHRGIPPFHDGDTLDDYLSAVRYMENVAIIVAENWHAYSRFLRPGVFDLVYVDGDHDYVAAERDAVLASQLEPTVVAFHDMDQDQVVAAARTVFGEPSGQVGSLGWYKR